MNTSEKFDLPGLDSPDTVIENLKSIPRELSLVDIKIDIIVRVIIYVLGMAGACFCTTFLLSNFLSDSDIWAWFGMLIIAPLALFFFPWLLCSSLVKKKKSFSACQLIYKNGLPVKGNVVMLSYISGHDYSSYFSNKAFHPSQFTRRVRVDYTFTVNDEVKVGFVFLHEKNMRYLTIDSEICVLYDPSDHSRNMLFPIPGEEMCSGCLR